MPTEVRRITFKRDELAEALQSQAAESGIEVSESALSFVQGRPGDRPGGHQLQIVAGTSVETSGQTALLDAEIVGSALVRHCLDCGIPIPKKARRSLSINKGEVALWIHMDEEAEEAAVELPDYYEYDFYG